MNTCVYKTCSFIHFVCYLKTVRLANTEFVRDFSHINAIHDLLGWCSWLYTCVVIQCLSILLQILKSFFFFFHFVICNHLLVETLRDKEWTCQAPSCQNGGTCKPGISKCVCRLGYVGDYCECKSAIFSTFAILSCSLFRDVRLLWSHKVFNHIIQKAVGIERETLSPRVV